MAKYFTLEELIKTHHPIANDPTAADVTRLTHLVDKLLDPVRERWGAPITVTSGYRSQELNKRVGGAANSQHLRGEAADITTGKIGGNKVLFDLIRTMQSEGELTFDQLIDEENYSWLHVSLKTSDNRNQILHLK